MTDGRFRFGPVSVEIRGATAVADALRRELVDGRVAPSATVADVTFEVGDGAPPSGDELTTQAGRRFPYRFETAVLPGGLRFAMGAKPGVELYRLDLDTVDVLADEPLTARATVPSLPVAVGPVVDGLARLLTRDYVGFDAVVAKNVMYELVDPLVWLALLRRSATFVHAGAVVAPGGGGVLLMGTGGVGKTTTVLDLALRRGWRYLGDDLVVLGADGLARYPKNLQVYSYNTALVPGLERRLLAGRSWPDRLAWRLRGRLLGPASVRRRVTASTLLGADAVADDAPLAAALTLTAAPASRDVQIRPVDPLTVARQASSVLSDEFWDFVRFVNATATLSPGAPTVGELQAVVTGVLARALEGHPCYEVLVPPRTPGERVGAALESVLDRLADGVGVGRRPRDDEGERAVEGEPEDAVDRRRQEGGRPRDATDGPEHGREQLAEAEPAGEDARRGGGDAGERQQPGTGDGRVLADREQDDVQPEHARQHREALDGEHSGDEPAS